MDCGWVGLPTPHLYAGGRRYRRRDRAQYQGGLCRENCLQGGCSVENCRQGGCIMENCRQGGV